MKPSQYNPLRIELARGQHAGPHPDADVLTALGEGSLLKVERQQVLDHIAVCGECREVLSIAAAAALALNLIKQLFLSRSERDCDSYYRRKPENILPGNA